MCHVIKYSTIRGVFRGDLTVCARVFSAPSRHLESGVDPGNEVVGAFDGQPSAAVSLSPSTVP